MVRGRKTNRIFALLLAGILALSTAGCGCSEPGAAGTKIATTVKDGENAGDKKETNGVLHTVTFSYLPEGIAEVPAQQIVADGECALQPELSTEAGYVFLAWLPDDHRSLPYSFTQPVTGDISLTGFWLNENDTKDTDGDGLPDSLEAALGTDTGATDTDRDGLSDGTEYLYLHLDPLITDTDGNGIPDGEEDTDGDGLKNAEEDDLGCNPAYYDSDFDGLGDHEELYTWHTDPNNEDTDGDGVTDGDEVSLGTDPLTPDTSFTTALSFDDIAENNPVTIEVSAITDAAGAGTLIIEQLDTTDIPALNSGSIGYLAPAYSLTTEGELSEATLTFTYDPALCEGSEDCDPTIYWYDKEEGELVEVAGQVKGSGYVTATVTHFSSYGLFDKSEIDKVREMLLMPTKEQLDTDTNGDRLPDVIAEWLNDGILPFNESYMLVGCLDMFGTESADWDEDGLLNGEEIEVGLDWTGRVKIKYISNPFLADTDGDGISDYDEKEIGTSPLEHNHAYESGYHNLTTNSKYLYATHEMEWAEQRMLDLVWDKEEKAKEFMIDYLYDYAPYDTLSENAETIAELEKHKQAVEIIGVFGKVAKIVKSVNSLADSKQSIDKSGKKIADMMKDPEFRDLYPTNALTEKNMIEMINKKQDDVMIAGLGMYNSPEKLYNGAKTLLEGDLKEKVGAAADLIGQLEKAVSVYKKMITVQQYSMGYEFGVYKRIGSALKKTEFKPAATALTVACDVIDAVEEIAEIQMTYGKIKANMAAYNRYIDMLVYVKNHAPDDFVKNAASKLAEIVYGDAEAYAGQLADACAQSAVKAVAKTALDVAAKYNSYAAVAKLIVDLFGLTGIENLTTYNIYFKVMKAFSDGCRVKLDELVTVEGSTFRYDPEYADVVSDYLVQLAQTRVVGEYYLYEYCADNTGAGWLSWYLGGGDKTPDSYIEDGKNRIRSIYEYINRLKLRVSKNLPYYNDFYDPTLPDERIEIVLSADRAIKDAAGVYLLASGAGAWETRFELKKDGSFTGYYYDMDMGFSGTMDNGETYNGTMYERTFRGRFEIGEQLDDYRYELILAEYEFDGTDGEEKVENDWGATRHVNSPAAGLEGWDTYILYSPYTPSSMLQNEPWQLTGVDQDYLIGFGNSDDETGEIRSYFWRTGRVYYSSYSTAYSDFIIRKLYLNNSSLKFGTDAEVYNAMRDLDDDGIPELILTNGFSARTDRAAYIFTYDMGEVTYLGIGPSDAYYLDDPRYPGIFGKFDNNWTYYTKWMWWIRTESVAEGGFDPPFTKTTADDALYAAFEKGPRVYLYQN